MSSASARTQTSDHGECPDVIPTLTVLKPRRPNVVFVDWAGTMSHSTFWSRWKGALLRGGTRAAGLFGDPKLVRGWMRGRHAAEEIVEMLRARRRPANRWLGRRVGAQLLRDAADLTQAFRTSGSPAIDWRPGRHCNGQYGHLPAAGGPLAWTLLELVDEVLDSSRLGCLKADRDPSGRSPFFHSWFEAHGVRPSESVLFDDGGQHAEEIGIAWVPVTPDKPLAPALAALLDVIRAG